MPDRKNQQTGKRNIFLLGSQMETGGAQKALLQLGDWFHTNGYPVTAVFLYDKDGLHANWQSTHLFPILNMKAWQKGGGVGRVFRLPAGLLRLLGLMRRQRFDAVITFTHDSNLVGLPLAWLADIPVRVATHRGRILSYPGWLERLHAWLVNSRLASVMTAVSSQVKAEAVEEGIRAEKVTVIPNGIVPVDVELDTGAKVRAQLGIRDGEKLVLSVGRVTRQKGFDLLVEAARRVLADHPDTTFLIAGDGPEREGLARRVEELGLGQHVRFLGVRRDVRSLLAACDLFVMSSRFEGMANALLEAMAAGRAVVTTDVSGARDLMESGESGVIIPIEDPTALASAVTCLLEDDARRAGMGQAAQTRILEQFTVEHMCRAYAALLEGQQPV